MKGVLSYLFPIAAIFLIFLCDFAFCLFNLQSKHKSFTYFLITIYNLLVCMSIMSLLMTWCKSPGYVPKKYFYKVSEMSKTTAALYKFA